MTLRIVNWIRHALTDFSERKVEDAIDDSPKSEIDFEILNDTANPMCAEMRRRYHTQQAREEQIELE